jgi:hypothetical protein
LKIERLSAAHIAPQPSTDAAAYGILCKCKAIDCSGLISSGEDRFREYVRGGTDQLIIVEILFQAVPFSSGNFPPLSTKKEREG